MSMDLDKAYHLVFRDLMLHGPRMFKGHYDAAHGDKSFMYGIQVVMQHIAFNDSDDESFEKFSDMFQKNMAESEDKAQRDGDDEWETKACIDMGR